MKSWSDQEMSGAQVSHGRCLRNLSEICESLEENAGLCFSSALGSRLRQSAHRLTEKEQTTPSGLLAGHRLETVARCAGHPLILAIQDTCSYDYSTHVATTGLGPLESVHTRGLFGHGVLAALPSGVPMGVLDVLFWTRDPDQIGIRKTRNHRPTSEKESRKWLWGLECVERSFDPEQRVLLIQDREADIFAFMAAPRRPNTNLLIRASRPRMVEVAGSTGRIKLPDAVDAAPVQGTFKITVPRKPGEKERIATLELRILEVVALPPANQLPDEPKVPQRIWVVDAREIDTPDGKEAISWTLLTTMPVNTFDEGRQMVEFYTCRWLIERLHYTIKSGCQAERLQIDDAHSLSNTLALFYVVAWRLLYMIYMARTEPEAPASELFSDEELVVLQQKEKTEVSTVAQAIKAVAKQGGYQDYRNAPPPGVKVLWIGFRKLEAMVEGWKLAVQYSYRG